ncbi:MAG: hypothetical protein ACRCUP_03490 [Mycoplasmatales bacterium]
MKKLFKTITLFLIAFTIAGTSFNAAETEKVVPQTRKTVECGANWTYGAGVFNAWSKTVSTVCAKSATVVTSKGTGASGRIDAGKRDAYGESPRGGRHEYYYNIWE